MEYHLSGVMLCQRRSFWKKKIALYKLRHNRENHSTMANKSAMNWNNPLMLVLISKHNTKWSYQSDNNCEILRNVYQWLIYSPNYVFANCLEFFFCIFYRNNSVYKGWFQSVISYRQINHVNINLCNCFDYH